MLDPGKLHGCIDTGGALDDRSIARELARVAGYFSALEAEQMTGEAYIAANRALDGKQERLTRKKAKLVAAMRTLLQAYRRLGKNQDQEQAEPLSSKPSRFARGDVRDRSVASQHAVC
jgi:hypothetical protein